MSEREAREELLLEVAGVPVHVGVLWDSPEAARGCARGDVSLAFDPATGLIRNRAFDPERVDYTLRYDNALHFSPYFQAYEDRLARRLVERYDLRGKQVIEIGAGGGRFLRRLCELGDNRGTGFDPSHRPESDADAAADPRVSVVRDYYSEHYADHAADLVCCRHVLEHIPDPLAFVTMLRRALDARPETALYFEVPNSHPILRGDAIWDVIYEHCGYFVPESLAGLFEACGFEVLDVHETYEGQFVGLEARVAAAPTSGKRELGPLAEAARRFGARFRAQRERWQARLAELSDAGRRAVVWGGGAKAVSFLNLLELGDRIEYVVDVNPGKQGTFLAGSGQEIVAPEFLRAYRPDVAIVMNPVYREEIAAALAEVSPGTKLETV